MDPFQSQPNQIWLGMLPKHRELILKNTEKLIDETNYDILSKECLTERLLNRAMINKIESIDLDNMQRERHRRLFEKLTKRGPEAFEKLKNILKKCDFNAALQRLNEDQDDDNYNSLKRGTPAAVIIGRNTHIIDEIKNNDENYVLQSYDKEINPRIPHMVIKSTHIHEDNIIPVYPMKSQHNRGVLFMVNIIDFVNKEDYRSGAKEDSESMLHLFKEMGFKLFAYENLKYEDFFPLLDAVIKSEDVRKAECFVMALMTHGDMNEDNRVEKVQLTDGSVIFVNEILSRFNNDACRNLINKPKIFLFPFCRGNKSDIGHKLKTQADSIRRVSRCPEVSDILICYATLPGFRAHRDPTSGSWYIQCFCENMANHAANHHFEDILKMIQDATSKQRSETGAMQTANYNNLGFNKKLYFNPGIFEKN